MNAIFTFHITVNNDSGEIADDELPLRFSKVKIVKIRKLDIEGS